MLRQPVVIDGGLEEWQGAAEVGIRSADQALAKTDPGQRAWQGERDLSATIWIGFDPSHLLLAGRVRDDNLVLPSAGRSFAQADRLEVWLSAAGQTAQPLLLLLAPMHERSWIAADAEVAQGQAGALVHSDLTVAGVRVASKAEAPNGYVFEAAIPLTNVTTLEPGARELRAGLVLVDHDPGHERALRMAWDGRDPLVDPRALGTLRAAELLLSPTTGGGHVLWQSVADYLPYFALPLAVLLLLLGTLRLWHALLRFAPRLRPAGTTAGAVLFLIGLLLPPFVVSCREQSQRQRGEDLVTLLREQIPQMERGTLMSYRGGQRDAPLVQLLSGRPIERRPLFDHRYVMDLVPPNEPGLGARRMFYPFHHFPVLPYWIPLPPQHAERFDFRTPIYGGALNIVVSIPAASGPPPSELPRARLVLWRRGEPQPLQVLDLEFTRPLDSGSAFSQPRRDMTFEAVAIDRPVDGVSLTALQGEGMQLVGLTWMPSSEGDGRPLPLGHASLPGVESDLRGQYPEDAGFELWPRGSSASLRRVALLAERVASYQKLWVFHAAQHPGLGRLPSDLQTGTPICDVRVHFAGGQPVPLVVTLRHQSSVFFGQARSNARDDPSDPRSALAFQWEGGDGERHVELVHEIDLPEGAAVGELEFENLGPYRLRIRSLVFGISKPSIPFDQSSSPLELVDEARRVAAKPWFRDLVRGAEFAVYRDAQLSESTLPAEEQQARRQLPRRVQRQLQPPDAFTQVVEVGDERRLEAYVPLSGDGWGDAVLAIIVRDPRHAAVNRLWNLGGLGLCLLSTPVLLLLLGQALSALASLRLRLVTLLSVATLVPLAILSVVLVSVLESEREGSLQTGMREDLALAKQRLRDEQEKVVRSAQNWLQYLSAALPPPAGALDREGLRALSEGLLRGQMPPDWKAGVLRFTAQVAAGAEARSVTAACGDPTLLSSDLPLRAEPGFYLVSGLPACGVHLEHTGGGWRTSLSALRVIDQSVLQGAAGSRAVLLSDARGYPLVATGGEQIEVETLLADAQGSAAIAERRAALATAVDSGQPDLRRHGPTGDWIAVYDVIRDVHNTPRAILGVLGADQPATLPLAIGLVPVRGFFVACAGLLVLLTVFLSFVVTTRISRPIERLERGARALSRGELDVRVASDESGAIGRLTEAFNRMAQDLRCRIEDLHHLNRGIQDLTARTDPGETLSVTRAFCARHSPADRVVALLRDREWDRVELWGQSAPAIDRTAPDVQALLRAVGPCVLELGAVPDDQRALPRLFPAFRSLLALPLIQAGRTTGALLLLFEDEHPPAMNLELLSALAAQAAAAIENARLFRHAVVDQDTGAYLPEHFRRLVEREVARAESERRSLALLEFGLADGSKLLEALGHGPFERFFESFVSALRLALPEDSPLCRSAEHGFQALVRERGAAAARALRAQIAQALSTADLGLPAALGPLVVAGAAAAFPEEAASAEFLFDALGAAAEGPVAQPGRVRRLRETGFVFSSPPMQEILRQLERAAPSDLSILLQGETGTGKEVLCDLIHRWSKRSAGPLVKVHCAALPATLLESELFGHERGAFTGAVARKLGRFELADGGTIFLDEIGEVPPDIQVKLLRVLQQKEIDRVGGSQPTPIDVRVIAATNRDLKSMVASGAFREDLYYRLQGLVLTVPALRERKQEIPALVHLFHREAIEAGYTQASSFSAEAMDELYRCDWPGNVRELRNTVFRALVMASGEVVKRTDLKGLIAHPKEGDPVPPVTEAVATQDAGRKAAVSGANPDTEPGEGAAAATIPPAELTGTPGGQERATPPIEDVPALSAPGLASESPTAQPAHLALGLRHQRLLRLIAERQTLSTADYVTIEGVSPRTGLRDLGDLLQAGLIERLGSRRGARYRLVNRHSDQGHGLANLTSTELANSQTQAKLRE
jgi:transcriptional regulator with GAF, ATPase, and Fis domain/HAMP domain-containing protein